MGVVAFELVGVMVFELAGVVVVELVAVVVVVVVALVSPNAAAWCVVTPVPAAGRSGSLTSI